MATRYKFWHNSYVRCSLYLKYYLALSSWRNWSCRCFHISFWYSKSLRSGFHLDFMYAVQTSARSPLSKVRVGVAHRRSEIPVKEP